MNSDGSQMKAAENSADGTIKSGWVLLVIAWVLFLVPVPGLGIVGWVLNFVAFIIAIVVLSKGRTGPGIAQLLCSLLASPIVYFIGLGVMMNAMGNIGSGTEKARTSLAKAQIHTLGEKVQSYELDTGMVPATLNDLAVRPAGIGDRWLGPYVKDADLRDPWGNAFHYERIGEKEFALVSYGADGESGGTGVNEDISYE